ncbi:hypothetical protein B7494_g1885 [Chlorociboria aeruginascens]|nr:hypothetical protein B7494_g1885 [Chlorociboria aeruginascens]
MINFGVHEVANSKAAPAPGWAYVPDTGANASTASLAPGSRRAARNQAIASSHETTAKQDAKILRELAALDRENHRDVSIPVPIRHRDNAGRVSHGKVTPAVRKILLSQKTFANHLSDFEALSAPQPGTSQPAAPQSVAPAIRRIASSKKKDAAAASRRVSMPGTQTPSKVKAEPSIDTAMAAAAALSQGSSAGPPPHPADSDLLLMSRVPQMPTQGEIERLLAAPPLSYNEARGSWTEDDRRKPEAIP